MRRYEPQFDFAPKRQFNFTEDVELMLLHGCIANSNRLRCLVTGEPVDLALRDPTLTAQAVKRLNLRGSARDGPAKPVTPGTRLLTVTGVGQGQDRES